MGLSPASYVSRFISLLNSNVASIRIEILQSLRSFRMTVSAFVILSEAKNLARVMQHFNSELILRLFTLCGGKREIRYENLYTHGSGRCKWDR